jgi:hypothetical protein
MRPTPLRPRPAPRPQRAGRDAAEAAQAATEALQIAAEKRRQEEEEQRQQDAAFGSKEFPDRIDEYENGTLSYVIDGTCHLNDIPLPKELGTGSCVALVHDFDI